MKSRIITGLVFVGAVAILIVLNLDSKKSGTADPRNSSIENQSVVGKVVAPVGYGNGVYYFACIQDRFANSLSAFLGENQNLKVDAISGNGTSTQGFDSGYFVVFSEK